jgi:hypothetical protein
MKAVWHVVGKALGGVDVEEVLLCVPEDVEERDRGEETFIDAAHKAVKRLADVPHAVSGYQGVAMWCTNMIHTALEDGDGAADARVRRHLREHLVDLQRR